MSSATQNPHKAIVLAAGLGTRLRPLTCAVPKPLLPVWNEPMLARIVAELRSRGVDDIAVNCHHLHGQIEDWCKANGCRVSCEPEILGTGGALNPLREWIGGEPFYLVNGDIVIENAPRLEKALSGKDTIAAAAVTEDGPRTIEVEPESRYVTCWATPDPGWSGTFTYCGFALVKPEILDYVPPSGFSTIVDAFDKAMMEGKFVKAVCAEDMLWTDAGTIERYIEVNTAGDENALAAIPQVNAALEAANDDAEAVEFIGARGSDRVFFKTPKTVIAVYDDSKRGENAKYAGHSRWLAAHGVPVPSVLADLAEMKTLALENAGSEDLQSRKKRRGEDALSDYVKVVEALAAFGALGAEAERDLELEPRFDSKLYGWEHSLFFEHCLGSRFHIAEAPRAVVKELKAVAERLEAEPPSLVHRDFQSTNVIWKNDGFKFIDFQGMRIGPGVYDLASLLYDPYVTLREGERRALAALYGKKSAHPEIAETLPFAAVQRLAQALGAYGRLASVGQPQFGRYVLPALENLLSAADDAGLDAIGALAEDLISKEEKSAKAHGSGCKCGGHGHGHDHECKCGGHEHGHDHKCKCGGEP